MPRRGLYQILVFRTAAQLLVSGSVIAGGFSAIRAAPIARVEARVDYEYPPLLTGHIYPTGSYQSGPLFNFERRATRSGNIIRVRRDFIYPNGSLADRETVLYNGGHLLSYELDDRQSGLHRIAVIRADPKNPARQKIFFQSVNAPKGAAKEVKSEHLQPDTLISDMIPPFIVSHWGELMNGSMARFRFIVLSRSETVGFKLSKESEGIWQGKRVVRLRMEPTSLVIAPLVRPVFFTVEGDGAHRILHYAGRTTPKIRAGRGWKDLDATTVFDWKSAFVGRGANKALEESTLAGVRN